MHNHTMRHTNTYETVAHIQIFCDLCVYMWCSCFFFCCCVETRKTLTQRGNGKSPPADEPFRVVWRCRDLVCCFLLLARNVSFRRTSFPAWVESASFQCLKTKTKNSQTVSLLPDGKQTNLKKGSFTQICIHCAVWCL